MMYFFLLLALTFNAGANILIKLGSRQFSLDLKLLASDPLVFLKNGYFVLGLCFFAAALVLYTLVLSKMNLSIAYPIMTSVGFLFVISFSVFYLGESMHWWQWLGIVSILFGVVLLSQGTFS
jgi:multidrug transporter EmrE-like cation transporter